MSVTLTVHTDADGRLSAIDPSAACLGCGCEPEAAQYFTRTYTNRAGEPEKIRVGYHCSCGAVVVDGVYQGSGM